MASFRGFKALLARKILRLRDKILRRKPERPAEKSGAEKRGIVIGNPYNFRREEMTMGVDCADESRIVEQAREDALIMHQKSKADGPVPAN